MGGVIFHLNYHCCIHDSTFKDECSDNDDVEKIAMDIGGHSLEKVESFLTDISPVRCSKKND